MLHMIVSTHNPESCAFRGKEEEELLNKAGEEFEESLPASDLALKGSWVNRAAHEIFMLVDAPNAHVIEEALLAAGLVGRTHSRVLPVVALEDAMNTEDSQGEKR
ncbi:hypothetical protein BH18ACT16_BH18ACT16_14870 [soil metagenome]